MKARPRRGEAAAFNQRGAFALIAILALAALIAAYMIATGLSRSSADLSNEREDRSMNALRQAKAALIAYAANEQWQLYKGQVIKQPGALPCPDNNDDGDADCVLPNTNSLIGRLPWTTMGSDDLRDASGERLWYALSANFRKASGTTVINSDTQPCDTQACNPGQSHLTVSGTAPASNVVAVLFAPGIAILNQNRPPSAAAPAHNDPVNYLENFSLGDGVHFTFTTTAQPSDTFNDRLLVITQADLMTAVESVVAARIERDVKPRIQTYRSDWGVYPFAALFTPDPGDNSNTPSLPPHPRPQSQYRGVTALGNGLLPLTIDPSFAGWQTASISVTQIPPGTGTTTVTSVDCSGSSRSQIVCQIDYSGGSGDRPDIQLQATLLNVANTFIRPVVSGDVSMVDRNGIPTPWSSFTPPPLPTPSAPSNTLQASGNATFIVRGRLVNAALTNNRITITVPVSYNPITDINDATSGWFIANEWFRQTYYAVAPGFQLGGSNNCIANPCLTVNNLASPNNKQAILVFAGRALNGISRPSGTFANYLENANLSAALGTIPYVYQHRVGVPSSINDRVVDVSP